MGTVADAYERERRMVELGAKLPEEAAGITSGARRHFAYYRFEAFEGEGLTLSGGDMRFMYGWRKAANGDGWDEMYAEGWDAFAERYPALVKRDPWDFHNEGG